ncbi:MAG: hypothetical protein EOO55_03420 [Hymenobacter sp.]|nr:MAG: hypothetical protein EOO55_03420 [Hymenobacter sp.]
MSMYQAPLLTADEVISIAQQALRIQSWPYDTAVGLQPTWRGISEHVLGQEGKPVGLWSVSFLTPAGLLDQENQFIEIDDTRRAPLGILTSHNYFFL